MPFSTEPTCLAIAVRDRGVDRVLGDVALGARIVVAGAVAVERAALALHLVGGLPGPDDHLADPAHRLGIELDMMRDDAAIVEHVLGADRLGPDAALGEGHVLGDAPDEVVADHQHVEMFVDRVHGKGPRGVGAGGKDVGQAGDLDDVRRMTAARTLGVEGVDRAALDGRDRVVDKARTRSACRCGSRSGCRIRRRPSGWCR